MKYAIIDIGSNTIKIDIYYNLSLIFNRALPVGLIKYIDNGSLNDKGVTELITAIDTLRLIAEAFVCDNIYYIATASLRGIGNQADVLGRAGVDIEIISGDEEAHYSYSGLKIAVGSDITTGLMIDMGGGSTEILGFKDDSVQNVISLPFGCLKLFLDFNDDVSLINQYIDSLTSDIGWLKDYGDTVYLIGGTARSLELFGDSIQSYGDLISLLNKIKNDKELIKSVVPDRTDTIVPGLIAYCRLLHHMEVKNVAVTQASVRAGYLMNKIYGR